MTHSKESTYPASYSDSNGVERTVIRNDGQTLSMAVRGVVFSGSDFDAFAPAAGTPSEALSSFSLNDGDLCCCRIECRIPIPLTGLDGDSLGHLSVALVLGAPTKNGGLDQEQLGLVLSCQYGEFSGSGTSGWFEDDLLEIQAQLPKGTYMRACINCLYSDYSPYGHGAFGAMMCFRNIADEYVQVTSKEEFWSVHDRFDRLVQETFLCSQFCRRTAGTGYRG